MKLQPLVDLLLNNNKIYEYISLNLTSRDPFSNPKIENYKYSQLNKLDYNKSLNNIYECDLEVKDNFINNYLLNKKIVEIDKKLLSWNFKGPDSALRLAAIIKNPKLNIYDLDNFKENVCIIDISKYEDLNIEFNYSKKAKLSILLIDSDKNKNSNPRYISFNLSKDSEIEILSINLNKSISLLFYEFNLSDFSKVNVTTIQANNLHLRNEFYFNLQSNCSAKISGANFCNSGVNDNYSFMQHSNPNSSSREVFKSIVDNGAITNFQGKIYVDSIAQKTDGYQMSKSLLLDDISRCNNKPELEIYADDVKCSHGSTVSKIDNDLLYYFNSRGINSELAINILKKAFIKEILDSIETLPLRSVSDRIVSNFLS